MKSRPESGEIVTWLGLAATFVLLFVHAGQYFFLTDDAFISFRYAVNFVHGDGLVFNPGLPPVEGYTNFLWVVLLSIFYVVGVPPEITAHILSLSLTAVLWGMLAWYGLRRNDSSPRWLAVLPVLFLAVTRTIAVWSTGGLETRLFEVLVIAGALRLIVELEDDTRRPWSAFLLALATLTRPDGLLISGCAMGTAGLFAIARTRTIPMWLVRRGAIYTAIVAAHFIFRRLYYGDWLPNTYYAKVGGRTWWDVGFQYLGAFLLEYGAYLWIPFLVAAIVYHLRKPSPWVPAIMFAVVLPHTLYVVSIGGDHFEYRPLDLYLPFVFMLMYDGVCRLARGRRSVVAVCAWSVVVVWGLVAIPLQSHLQFPTTYVSGFPGLTAQPSHAQFLDPSRDPIYRLPLLRNIARTHQRLLRSTTFSFSGLRQEEHAGFLDTVVQEGKMLRELVNQGTLPADTHIAIDAVGAIPFYSGLPVLDRLGLTDREVARSANTGIRRLAHDKHASFDYAVSQGVDVWAVDDVHLVYRIDDPAFAKELRRARKQGEDAYFADLGDGFFMLGRLPAGIEAASARFDAIGLVPIDELRALEPIFDRALRGYRAKQAESPEGTDLLFAEASLLTWIGRSSDAIKIYEMILERDPRSVNAYNDTGLILLDGGYHEAALESFEAALSFSPDNAIVRYNRALALTRLGRVDEAAADYRRAIEQMPFLTDARINLGLLLVREGRVDEGLSELERVVAVQPENVTGHVELAVALSRAGRIAEAIPHYQEAIRLNERTLTALNNLAWIRATNADDTLRDGEQAVRLAEAACEQTRYTDPFYLTTLGVAYAEAGRYDDALRASRRAIEVGADQPQLVQRLRQLMRIFESGRPYHEPAAG